MPKSRVAAPRPRAHRLERTPERDDRDEFNGDGQRDQESRRVLVDQAHGALQHRLGDRPKRRAEEVRDEIGRESPLPEEEDERRAATEEEDVAGDIEDGEREDAPAHRKGGERKRPAA